MTDDDRLRQVMKTAQDGEAAPPFRALLEQRRRRRFYFAPLALGAAVLAAVLMVRRPPPAPVELAALHVDSRGPLDFLLEMPGNALLTTTPHFDTKGDWP